MNFNSTLPINGNVGSNIPMHFQSRTKSLIPQSNNSVSANSLNELKNNGLGVMNKLKQIFSTKQPISADGTKDNANISNNYFNTNVVPPRNSRTKLQTTSTTSQLQNSSFSQYGGSNYNEASNNNVEWQPVYHDTCKIKLPVNQLNAKIAMPQEAIDEWTNDQAKISKGALDSLSKIDINKNSSQTNGTSTESQTNCLNSCVSQNTCTSKDEPYSKFKYYYNYYLVDEYLDSLAQSQNKKLDANGINEEGELYENVSLGIKPILKTKERLESGVPYDPKVLLN